MTALRSAAVVEALSLLLPVADLATVPLPGLPH
jgi:hypothetical protein